MSDIPNAPHCHMICSECGRPSMFAVWDWFEADEDKLWCPKCGRQSQISEWIDGEPQWQPCLMCGGTGVGDERS